MALSMLDFLFAASFFNSMCNNEEAIEFYNTQNSKYDEILTETQNINKNLSKIIEILEGKDI